MLTACTKVQFNKPRQPVRDYSDRLLIDKRAVEPGQGSLSWGLRTPSFWPTLPSVCRMIHAASELCVRMSSSFRLSRVQTWPA